MKGRRPLHQAGAGEEGGIFYLEEHWKYNHKQKRPERVGVRDVFIFKGMIAELNRYGVKRWKPPLCFYNTRRAVT